MSASEFNKVFSTRLKYYLNKYDMTQLDLAKKLGVGTTSVSNWCNGLKSPRMDKVDTMCEIFHCSRSDLMEDKNDRFSPEGTILAAKVAKSPELKQLITYYESADETGKLRILENAADMAKLYPKDKNLF